MARIWKFGSDVDTDQIVPGRYAPYMRPNEDVGSAAFIEARPDFAEKARPGDIIVAGENFGCGSSREYAPLALKRRGVVIIAASFARIFFRNAVNLGIPILVAPQLSEKVQDGEEVTLDLTTQTLHTPRGTEILPRLPKFAEEIIAAGGIIPYVKKTGRFPGEG
jgi:methanogen homoaconitase small subunit